MTVSSRSSLAPQAGLAAPVGGKAASSACLRVPAAGAGLPRPPRAAQAGAGRSREAAGTAVTHPFIACPSPGMTEGPCPRLNAGQPASSARPCPVAAGLARQRIARAPPSARPPARVKAPPSQPWEKEGRGSALTVHPAAYGPVLPGPGSRFSWPWRAASIPRAGGFSAELPNG
jgi:hypothetical protein